VMLDKGMDRLNPHVRSQHLKENQTMGMSEVLMQLYNISLLMFRK
jgi:hypothetical protein